MRRILFERLMPDDNKRFMAKKDAQAGPLSSTIPLPYRMPSFSMRVNGSVSQPSPAGTTSRWQTIPMSSAPSGPNSHQPTRLSMMPVLMPQDAASSSRNLNASKGFSPYGRRPYCGSWAAEAPVLSIEIIFDKKAYSSCDNPSTFSPPEKSSFT